MPNETKNLNKVIQIDGKNYNINAVTADSVNNSLTIEGNSTAVAVFNGGTAKSVNIKGDGATTVIANSTSGEITIRSTDDKVTSVTNHYTPSADSGSLLSAEASASTAADWNSTSLVTGVNLQRDSKGHITGVTVDSVKMPSNPNTESTLTISSSGNTNTLDSGMMYVLTELSNTTTNAGHDLTATYNAFPTKDYVDTAIESAQLKDEEGNIIDLSDYALVEDIPTKTSDLENDSGFITTNTNQTVKTGDVTFDTNAVVEFVAGSNISIRGDSTNKQITISSTDTNTESTLTITDKSNTDTSNLVYAVTNLVEGGTKGHTITPTYTGFPTKKYVDDAITQLEEGIPTHTGQLTNDSGYLTSIPVTMDSGDTFTTITISKNDPSNGSTGDIWLKY